MSEFHSRPLHISECFTPRSVSVRTILNDYQHDDLCIHADASQYPIHIACRVYVNGKRTHYSVYTARGDQHSTIGKESMWIYIYTLPDQIELSVPNGNNYSTIKTNSVNLLSAITVEPDFIVTTKIKLVNTRVIIDNLNFDDYSRCNIISGLEIELTPYLLSLS